MKTAIALLRGLIELAAITTFAVLLLAALAANAWLALMLTVTAGVVVWVVCKCVDEAEEIAAFNAEEKEAAALKTRRQQLEPILGTKWWTK